MKADLHVHSYHSGYTTHLPFLAARDCYSDPDDVYAAAKRRGMDLVCITDHDSVDGCLEFLDRHPDAPDFIIGEEIECLLPPPDGTGRPSLRVHLGAWGMTERLHREIQPLRDSVFDVAEYLTQQDVLFAVNHLFFFLDGDWPLEPYVTDLLTLAPALETRNGAMLNVHNELIEKLVAGGRFAGPSPIARIGGSDAHTLADIGRTYTEVPALTRDEFLAGLRAGRSRVGGAHGSTGRMTREVYTVITQYWSALLGARRHDLRWGRRLGGMAFSVPSLPFQFIPLLVAMVHKRVEAKQIDRYRRALVGPSPLPRALDNAALGARDDG